MEANFGEPVLSYLVEVGSLLYLLPRILPAVFRVSKWSSCLHFTVGVLGLQMHTTMPSFLCGKRESNLGHQTRVMYFYPPSPLVSPAVYHEEGSSVFLPWLHP